ncbi:MAG: Crp/Fnr family transcriptional regulator [Hahellaceae bacterium]|nr:Crp/Fnr family transcriptional regulator [Hahellaceae bacterium]
MTSPPDDHPSEISRSLLRSPWFASLPRELQAALQARGVCRAFAPGERIFSRGDAPCGLYTVLDGAVRITAFSEHGKEAILTLIEAPQWFGEITLFDAGTRTHDARAEPSTRLWQIPQAALNQLLQARPDYWQHFGRLLTEKLRLAFIALEDAALYPAPVRLARRLLQMSQSGVTGDNAGTRTSLALPQEVLGAMLGISRQTTNQILRDLEAQGLITLSRSMITLVDLPGLRTMASLPDKSNRGG